MSRTPAPPPPVTADPAWAGVQTHVARHEDTLLDLAVANDMGFLEVAIANPGVDPWLPGEGTTVLLPKRHLPPDAPQKGIVINLPEQRLYTFANGKLVRSYPIGIGRDGHSTPTGSTSIVRKAKNPTWYPTPSARADDPTLPAVFPPGPDNPLGSRALYLGWASYLIHGTNKEYGIGRPASRGCIRMYDAHVQALYDKLPVGTPVTVVDQPIKAGWLGAELYVEAGLTMEQVRQWEETGRFEPVDAPDARGIVIAKAGAAASRIDWDAFDRAIRERRGIPTRITGPDERPLLAADTAVPSAASGRTVLLPPPGEPAVAPLSGPPAIPAAVPAASRPPASRPVDSNPPARNPAASNPAASNPAAVPAAATRDPASGPPAADEHPEDLVKWLRGRLSGINERPGSAP